MAPGLNSLFGCPSPTDVHARTRGPVSMFGIEIGIGVEFIAGYEAALAAMIKSLILTAGCHHAFPVKGMSHGFNAAGTCV